ncbi:MAG: hypothetical protein NTW75_13715 [Planctomycetales bacterium]|jgi:hypothetical protein|nr:hypothetical protein [Planctomycetales bacterium]
MIRPEQDHTSVTNKAQAAFLDVQQSVIERAKQTHTPIIVFTDNRIQSLTAEEFERIELEKLSERIELGKGE